MAKVQFSLAPYEKAIELALELALAIYKDTPKERRVQNLENWYAFLDMLTSLGGKAMGGK